MQKSVSLNAILTVLWYNKRKGIAQMVVLEVPALEVETMEVDDYTHLYTRDSKRGEGKFGSSGK